jgi:hypothetical protein
VKILSIALALALFLGSGISLAQNSIQDLLGVGIGGAVGGKASGNSLLKSAAGEWRLLSPAKGNGLDCAVGFYGDAGFFGMIGPTADSKGTLLFMGSKLSTVNSLTETRMALITDKDPTGSRPSQQKAFQLPGSQAAVAITTDMAATLSGISDVKRVALEHNGNLILDLVVDGTFVARDALAQCMGLPRIASAR